MGRKNHQLVPRYNFDDLGVSFSKCLCYNQGKMGKGDGFTVIEVMLFLTISGALLLMAMIGSGEMARQARFSDSVNSFHSNMQRYYEDVVSGVNTRAVNDACDPGTVRTGTDSCLLIGRVISFTEDSSAGIVRYATASSAVPDTGSIYDQLRVGSVTVQASGEQPINLAWGALFQNASRASGVIGAQPLKQAGSTRALVNNVAFLRHPNGSEIVPYFFYSTNSTLASVQSGLTTALNALSVASATTATICITTSPTEYAATAAPVAAILLGTGTGSASIDTNYSPTRGPAGVCE